LSAIQRHIGEEKEIKKERIAIKNRNLFILILHLYFLLIPHYVFLKCKFIHILNLNLFFLLWFHMIRDEHRFADDFFKGFYLNI